MKTLITLAVTLITLTACKELPTTQPSPTPEPSPCQSATPCQCSSPLPSPPISNTPPPSPLPTATPWACNLPAMPNCAKNAVNCCKEGGSKKYHPMIQQAQNELTKTKPGLFNSDGSIKVSDVEYTTELARAFQDLHKICAVGGAKEPLSKDEIGIKETNGQAVHIDVVIGGSNKPWTGVEYTCSPAGF